MSLLDEVQALNAEADARADAQQIAEAVALGRLNKAHAKRVDRAFTVLSP